jgi:hypothetical protein
MDWFDSPSPSRLRLDLENNTGRWSLLALFNWEDRPVDRRLRLEEYFSDRSPFPPGDRGEGAGAASEFYLRRFWQPDGANRVLRLAAGAVLEIAAMPPHSVALFAARSIQPGQPQYLGSDLHISQGLEVAEWEVSGFSSRSSAAGQPVRVRLRLERPGRAAGRFHLALPCSPRHATMDGQPLQWTPCDGGCYAFQVEFFQATTIVIEF